MNSTADEQRRRSEEYRPTWTFSRPPASFAFAPEFFAPRDLSCQPRHQCLFWSS